jgi:hypothetical protein
MRTLNYHNSNCTRFVPELLRSVVAPLQPRFDLIVYLTADVKVRAERLSVRKNEDPGNCDELDNMVYKNPAAFVALDKGLERVVKDHSRGTPVLTIDTTHMAKHEVLDRVWEAVERVLAARE